MLTIMIDSFFDGNIRCRVDVILRVYRRIIEIETYNFVVGEAKFDVQLQDV